MRILVILLLLNIVVSMLKLQTLQISFCQAACVHAFMCGVCWLTYKLLCVGHSYVSHTWALFNHPRVFGDRDWLSGGHTFKGLGRG